MDKQLYNYYLSQLGLDSWILRPQQETARALRLLEEKVASCTACDLHKPRIKSGVARGSAYATLMIVIEDLPNELQQESHFVEKIDNLLNKMLKSIGINSEDVYITTLLKCQTSEERKPQEKEVKICSDYLIQQINLINPQVILGVGHVVGQWLFNTTMPFNSLREHSNEYQGKPVFVSYHPADLLRNPEHKKKAYSDLLKVKANLTATLSCAPLSA